MGQGLGRNGDEAKLVGGNDVWGRVDVAHGIRRRWKLAGMELGDWDNCEDHVENALSERVRWAHPILLQTVRWTRTRFLRT